MIGSNFQRVSDAWNFTKQFTPSLSFSTSNNASHGYQDGMLEGSSYFSAARTIKFFMPGIYEPYTEGSKIFKADRLRHDGSTYFGYFVEYFNGETFRLLGNPKLEVQESVQPKSGYSDSADRIKMDEEYFVVWDNGDTEKVRTRHRDIRKLFDTDEAQYYLKDKRVRSIEDLTVLVAFYDKNMPREN